MSSDFSDGSPLNQWGVGTAWAETVHVTSSQHIASCAAWRLFQVSGAHSHMVSCPIGESHREPAEIAKDFCSLDTLSNWLYYTTVLWQQQKFFCDTHSWIHPGHRTGSLAYHFPNQSGEQQSSPCNPRTHPEVGIKNRIQTRWGMEERGQGRWEEEKKGKRRVKDQKEGRRGREEAEGGVPSYFFSPTPLFPWSGLSSKEEERWEGMRREGQGETQRELFWLLTLTFSTLVSLFYFAFRS